MTWPRSVDEALCFGWIDGVRKSLDDERYVNRFTPRRKGSVWSAKNIRRVVELKAMGRMRPAGLKAFEARREDRSGIYSYERRDEAVFDPVSEKRFRSKKRARAFFEASPRSYRQAAIRWVMTAKKEETRERRLGQLIERSAAGERVPAAHVSAAPALRNPSAERSVHSDVDRRMALAFAAGIATAAVIVLLVRLEITQRVPSPSDCADLWNRPTNAEAQRDVETYGKVVVSGWDTKAGPHCSAMFFDRPGAPWQTYVLWLADPDGTSLAYHRDIGGESFGSPAWYFDLTGPTSPNASVGHRGRVVLT